MRIPAARASFAVVLVVVALIGCGAGKKANPPAEIVATVGTQQISLQELQRSFDETTATGTEYGRDSLSARRFLGDYISKTLIEQLAADSIPWTPILGHRVESYCEGQMVHKLRESVYGSATRITEEEVRKVYELANTRYHYREIVLPSQADAERNLRLIREGAVFSKISDHLTGRTDGGDRGWQTVLTAPESEIVALARLGPGEVGGPARVGQTYCLVQLIEKEPNPVIPPFEEEGSGFRIKVIQERGGLLLGDFNKLLFEKYKFQPYMDQVLWMTGFLRDATAGVKRTTTREELEQESDTSSFVPWKECPLPAEDFNRVLAVTTADTLTAVLLLDHLLTKLSFTWPLFENPDDTMTLLRELALDRLERAEAWARALDKDPDIAWRTEKQRKLIHSRQFYVRYVRNASRPTTDEARRWYEAQAAVQPEQYRYSVVLLSSWDSAVRARELFSEVRDAAEAFQAVRAVDPEATWMGEGTQAVEAGKAVGSVQQQILRLKPGGVTDPVPSGTRFTIARLEEIVAPQILPFESVADETVNMLADLRADSLLNRLVNQRRAITPVKVDEEVFARLRYAAPTS